MMSGFFVNMLITPALQTYFNTNYRRHLAWWLPCNLPSGHFAICLEAASQLACRANALVTRDRRVNPPRKLPRRNSPLLADLLLPNILTALVALTLAGLNLFQRARSPGILVMIVPVLVTRLLYNQPAILNEHLYRVAYRGLRDPKLAGQIQLRGNTEALVWAWVSERLTVGTLFRGTDDQVSDASEDRFGRALVFVKVAIKHREIFFECHG
jgi:hypothetical protein